MAGSRGRHARGRRTALAIAGSALTAALVGSSAAGAPFASADGTGAREPALPTVVNAPGAWSEVETPDGPVAAMGLALRTVPAGLVDSRQQLSLFTVSAVDGRSTWLRLPRVGLDERPLVDWFALSPDGRWIGWTRGPRQSRDGETLTGWAVLDTVTGDVRTFEDPDHRRVRSTMSELVFSGDSRYLLTSYEAPGAPARRGHQLVAWDVASGQSTVLEEPGPRWLPNLGSAPSGVVWSRGDTVFRADPAGGAPDELTLPRDVLVASWGPDDRAFATVGPASERRGAPDRLLAGPSVRQLRPVALPRRVHPSQLLGWRDASHVVVGHHRTTVHVVDVLTGAVEPLDLGGTGEILNAPLLASDLWRRPLVDPPAPEGTADPRRPVMYAGGVAVGLLTLAFVLGGRPRRRDVADAAAAPV